MKTGKQYSADTEQNRDGNIGVCEPPAVIFKYNRKALLSLFSFAYNDGLFDNKSKEN